VRKITSVELKKLIEENSAEAVHIDFKQEWYKNNSKLIHDILCLSNADYNGDRFLLLGVNNNAEIVGLNDSLNRKENASLFDLLRKSNFNRLPDIDIYTLHVENADIDIIQIANTAHKPYFLLKDKSDNGTTVRAGGIVYSRNGSSNTPINSSASEIEIEKIWRERFGLDRTPFQRLKTYLLDFEGWTKTGENEWHYSQFPEFTIHAVSESIEDSYPPFWQRAATSSKSYALNIGFFYHQTLLKTMPCSLYDEMHCFAPEPLHKHTSIQLTDGITGCCFAYLADSFEFLFLQFLKKQTKDKLFTKNAPLKDRTQTNMPVFIIEHQQELEVFIKHLTNNFDAGSIVKVRTICLLGEKHPDSQAAVDFAYAAMNEYSSWKILS
jgi:hypothetical protein